MNHSTTTWSTRLAGRAVRVRSEITFALLDVVTVVVATLMVVLLRFDGAVPPHYWDQTRGYVPVAVLATLACNASIGLYGQIWQHASILEARRLVLGGAMVLTGLLGLALAAVLHIPASVVVLGTVTSTGLQGLLRFQARLFAFRRRSSDVAGIKVLVLGAGKAGADLVRDMLEHPHSGLVPVGVLDDDVRTHGRAVHGVRVLGPIYDLARHAADTEAVQAVLAVSDAPQELVSLASNLADEAGIALRVIPRPSELAGGLTVRDVRDLQIDDLLGRLPVVTDLDAVAWLLRGKRVLITGAGGSIGSEIARQVARCQPAELLLLDHDETHLYDTAGSISTPVTQLLCDIRQRGLVHRIIAVHEPHVVFHAAAHKHVPLLEDHPAEAIKTNVQGTQNLVDACLDIGVGCFVFISTDKAVRPSSVMGASKAVAEQIVLHAATSGLAYSAVRFGNVLGSRGSVIPTFVRQIQQGGPVTVTDARMTRFFMSIPEAVQLVLQTAALARGGEVFMLEMGEPVRIIDLAQRMIRLSGQRVGEDVEIRVTGTRPGEKLAEELSTPEERTCATTHPSIVQLTPLRLAPPVLKHEVQELVQAAENGFDAVVRASVFSIATLKARRTRREDDLESDGRRTIDLVSSERNDRTWTRSTT